MTRLTSLGTLMIAAGLLATGATRADEPKARPTNRLARELSPYLRQHAHNPVDWFPWGAEAFAKAQKEGKLVFLSIGYSSCHWCHVMERESFDNPEVAKLLNQWFVCIKVDREERPDIDNVYMTAVQVFGRRGGWPLSVFLTAQGKPFFGDTYWPREDRVIEGDKVPGFKTILSLVHEFHANEPKKLAEQADKLAEATAATLEQAGRGIALVDLDRKLVAEVVEAVKEEFDPEFGGFGSRARRFRGTKFPTPPYLLLLEDEAARTGAAEAAKLVDTTLDRMARGGIYDQLGGGFHRYSTERTWTVPHFEKMLYDNAQLVEVYAKAYQRTKAPLYRRVVVETLAFVGRELTSPEGAFYSALDADSEGEEGRYYVWTPAELAAVLTGDDAALFRKTYGLEDRPNFEEKYHILTLPKLVDEQVDSRLAPVRQTLLALRSKRERPFLDTKVLTGWNGQMIAGYAVAGQVFGEKSYLHTAARAADFVLTRLRTPEGRLLRTYGFIPGAAAEARLNGYLDDYAYFVHGLLCLHDATGERRWLDAAKALTDTMIQQHGDKAGGFYYTANDHEKLFARAKDQYDGAQPSGNSVAAGNLVRLAAKTGDRRYREYAEKTIRAFAASLKANPTALTALATSLAAYLDAKEPGNPTEAKEPAAQGGAQRSDAMVKVSATVEKPAADGKVVVTVTLDVRQGWHVYANPPGLDDLAGAQTTVTIRGKEKPESVKVEYPEGKTIKDKMLGSYKVYEGKVTIKATVQRAKGDAGPLEVSVKFQACDDKACLPPATVKVSVP